MRKSVFAMSAVITISACAQQPNAIAPAEVSRSAYTGNSCHSLKTSLYQTEMKLGQLSAVQSAEASKDAGWVAGGLLFLPVALVAAAGPDHSSEIAILKGQKNALREEIVSSRC